MSLLIQGLTYKYSVLTWLDDKVNFIGLNKGPNSQKDYSDNSCKNICNVFILPLIIAEYRNFQTSDH